MKICKNIQKTVVPSLVQTKAHKVIFKGNFPYQTHILWELFKKRWTIVIKICDSEILADIHKRKVSVFSSVDLQNTNKHGIKIKYAELLNLFP